MAEFPYTQSYGKLGDFLEKVQDMGVPDKLTQNKLEAMGFKGKNDRRIIGVMKFIGFIDSAQNPTERWQAYRDKARAGIILAKAIIDSYSDLFGMYPDAYRKDEEALRNYFRSNTSVGDKALGQILNTFKALCKYAQFDKKDDIESGLHLTQAQTINTPPISAVKKAQTGLTTVNINIELAIPPTSDSAIYDAFFKSMKKYLFGDIENE